MIWLFAIALTSSPSTSDAASSIDSDRPNAVDPETGDWRPIAAACTGVLFGVWFARRQIRASSNR
jgi:hypothetical protein